MSKIVSLENLEKEVSRLRQQGLRLVFTNGCFDLLQPLMPDVSTSLIIDTIVHRYAAKD